MIGMMGAKNILRLGGKVVTQNRGSELKAWRSEDPIEGRRDGASFSFRWCLKVRKVMPVARNVYGSVKFFV
jgi:hypothetical protein